MKVVDKGFRKNCECNFILMGVTGTFRLAVLMLLNEEIKMLRLFFFLLKYDFFFLPFPCARMAWLCKAGLIS